MPSIVKDPRGVHRKGTVLPSTRKSTMAKRPIQPRRAPPKGPRTIKHLVTQLEGQIARHSGYVPKKGVAMALFVNQHHQNHANGSVASFLPRINASWNKSKRWKEDRPPMVRLLDKDEW